MKRLLGRKLAVGLAVIASVMGVTTPTAIAEPTSGAGTNVVGGTPATHPWTVSLQSGTLDKPKHECGGTLIAPRWVMTAAHCEPYVHGRARIGSLDWKQGGELIEVKDVITHPDYPEPSGSFGNNIALVELKEPAHSEPIRLGTMGGNGQVNTVAGWGTTCDRDVTDPDCRGQVPDKLQQTDLRRVPGTECTLYNSAGVNLFYEPTMACFVAADGGKNGPCFGDSGSPYMQRFGTEWVAVGIQEAIMSSTTPYPYACSQGPNGTIDHFGATTVEPFRQWIVDTILATDPKGAAYIQSNQVAVG